MLAPRSDQKSMPTSKGRFCKNYCKTNEISMIFQSYGVEVGIKNQSKIHQKLKPKMDCLLASILVDFCGFWIDFGSLFWLIFEGQLVRKGNQNDERCQGQKPVPKERPGRRVRLRTPPAPPPPSPRGSAGIFRFPGALGEGKGGETEVALTRHMTPEGSADYYY